MLEMRLQPESSERHSSSSKAPNERWEQIPVVPSTTETKEKVILTFGIGFRGRWGSKERKKGIAYPFFPPPYLNQNYLLCPGWRRRWLCLRRTVLPTRSSLPLLDISWFQFSSFWAGSNCRQEESEERSDKVFCTESRSNTSWSLIIDYSSLKGRTSSNCIWQVLGQKICNRKHEGYDLFSLSQKEDFCSSWNKQVFYFLSSFITSPTYWILYFYFLNISAMP